MPDDTVRARAAAVAGSARRSVRGAPAALRRRWRTAPPHQRQTWRLSVTSAVVGLVVAFTAVAVAGPWDSGQRTAERTRAGTWPDDSGRDHTAGDPALPEPAPSAPEVLRALGAAPADGAEGAGDDAPPPAPTATALADTLEPLLDDPALGPVVSASVVDALTGKQLFGEDAARPVTPASTVKIATSVAVLSARGPGHRIETPVVRTGEGRIVLVGGGDPTLTGKDLDALAADVARALKRADDTPGVRLGYDVSRYSGPGLHPIGPNDNLAPVSPLMLNEARLDGSDHGPAPRAADPAAEAARTFAQRLDDHGVTVSGRPSKVTAGDDAERIAVHRSATVARLVERTLTHSDNDLAEALARQTALAVGEPASFDGAGEAVRARLLDLGLPVRGARFADGSGLDRTGKVTAELLTGLLALAADPGRPELRVALTGLPVAHFTGTLHGRYEGARGAGVVRAKTGTLTGVNTLAGTVVDADGRLLAFAFLTTGTKDRYGAQAALDRMASALANCGCR
ncbi:D-alanyl-D-alanine carboxypeptidase/D-alanyl-D-alanine-endopeptidase [Streptomyces sp. RKND-216]|uniref:D-alanyl-D-alanine carboxypeptidase/D-alanyl-D-alanine endopeptidase n=1 Tax=Streptomyces sp. RKND-216 TaxID=2562581 RepID=UPI00109DDADF|nr:D-alanyl-D-alanine carboxypeptidase/D-alanyl-D-alanine-endopeptidase [Streptomyces sp. RKND-216]THA25197.1 D-alanyl-D-alanine carboxypeptidase/D-alanyl-D-alanine-endopeptidase [Streptomyces sp. RKND-216]